MKISLSFFILLFSFAALGECRFNAKAKDVVSLSGVTTVLFKEMGLLKSPALKGISVFNPVAESEFKGTVYPGGVFLSQQLLTELDGKTVFYDESRDLKKILSSRGKVNLVEIKTRNFTPEGVTDLALKEMAPYLQGCEGKIKSIKDEMIQLQQQLKAKLVKDFKVVFYLGEIKKLKIPQMIIVQDGVVKWLIENKLISTYPSELSYVNWSRKILDSLPRETVHVGIIDSGRELKEENVKVTKTTMNLIYPGSLVPGISQLRAFVFWANHL